MEKIKNKKLFILSIIIPLFAISGYVFAVICENQILNFDYDKIATSNNMEWYVCPYTNLIDEQTALYKSMEHVNWISIEKIGGDGNTLDATAARGNYCLSNETKSECSDGGQMLENPGIVQKIDLWRQRLKTYQESKNLRPYYDSQKTPKYQLDDRYDESRMALLDWLTETRTKMEECVTGYSSSHKENSAKIRLFNCEEGVTATSATSYRIAPDFPYPVHTVDLNCFPFNSEYLTRTEKEQCARNKDRSSGCQTSLNKPSFTLATDPIYSTYIDDFYCTSGREQVAK